MNPYIEISGRKIGKDFPPLIIAEIGINHEGSLQVAKEMVDAAYRAGVEVVKKDNLQSARLAGLGSTDLASELYVDERYYGKISPVLEEFRMSL